MPFMYCSSRLPPPSRRRLRRSLFLRTQLTYRGKTRDFELHGEKPVLIDHIGLLLKFPWKNKV